MRLPFFTLLLLYEITINSNGAEAEAARHALSPPRPHLDVDKETFNQIVKHINKKHPAKSATKRIEFHSGDSEDESYEDDSDDKPDEDDTDEYEQSESEAQPENEDESEDDETSEEDQHDLRKVKSRTRKPTRKGPLKHKYKLPLFKGGLPKRRPLVSAKKEGRTIGKFAVSIEPASYGQSSSSTEKTEKSQKDLTSGQASISNEKKDKISAQASISNEEKSKGSYSSSSSTEENSKIKESRPETASTTSGHYPQDKGIGSDNTSTSSVEGKDKAIVEAPPKVEDQPKKEEGSGNVTDAGKEKDGPRTEEPRVTTALAVKDVTPTPKNESFPEVLPNKSVEPPSKLQEYGNEPSRETESAGASERSNEGGNRELEENVTEEPINETTRQAVSSSIVQNQDVAPFAPTEQQSTKVLPSMQLIPSEPFQPTAQPDSATTSIPEHNAEIPIQGVMPPEGQSSIPEGIGDQSTDMLTANAAIPKSQRHGTFNQQFAQPLDMPPTRRHGGMPQNQFENEFLFKALLENQKRSKNKQLGSHRRSRTGSKGSTNQPVKGQGRNGVASTYTSSENYHLGTLAKNLLSPKFFTTGQKIDHFTKEKQNTMNRNADLKPTGGEHSGTSKKITGPANGYQFSRGTRLLGNQVRSMQNEQPKPQLVKNLQNSLKLNTLAYSQVVGQPENSLTDDSETTDETEMPHGSDDVTSSYESE